MRSIFCYSTFVYNYQSKEIKNRLRSVQPPHPSFLLLPPLNIPRSQKPKSRVFANSKQKRYGRTDQRTYGRTDGRTDASKNATECLLPPN